jgi:aminopeptidase
MFDNMAPKLARIMTEYSQPIRAGDFVVVLAGMDSESLAMALHEAVLRRGGHPFVLTALPNIEEQFFLLANDEQLAWTNPVIKHLFEQVDVAYRIAASSNNQALARISPRKLQLHQQANQDINELRRTRSASGDYRWCALPWPTQADAQQAEMGMLAWTKFIYEACALHLDNPLDYWTALRDRQQQLVDHLSGSREIHVKGPGINLTLRVDGRTWVNSHGARNFPDGEIFTGPIEDSVNGVIEFNLPANYLNRDVAGVRLVYRDGVVVEATAEKGEDFLLAQLDLDDGARRMGEFAIGTNEFIQQRTGSILFDEKIGGTIHMALGRSIPKSGGVNQSQIHWDMVHDMRGGGEIWVDGAMFYHAGQFVLR